MNRAHVVRTASFIALIAAAASAACLLALPDTPIVTFDPLGVPVALRLDAGISGLARPFLALVALVVPATAMWGLKRGAADDGARLAIFAFAMIGVLVAQSVAAFAIAWEVMSLVSAFLVGTHHERRDVRRALLSYVLVSQFGALCIVTELALLGANAGSYAFGDIARSAPSLPAVMRATTIALALVGFGSKAGLVPLHFWLPRAHPVAPANASALLSGVMLKVAVYGLLVTTFALAAPLPLGWAITIVIAGLVTALTGALYAAVDSDVKRLLAYSSIEHLGIIVATLGLSLAALAVDRPQIAQLALVALFVHALGHGIFKSLLFLCAGNVVSATHTTDLEHLGGLGRTLPLTAFFAAFGCAAAAALPPLIGFASEWLVFRSFASLLPGTPALVQVVVTLAIAMLALTGGLAGLAFVKLFGVAFLGEPRARIAHARERADISTAGLLWLAALALGLGLMPAVAVAPLAAIAGRLSGVSGAAIGGLPTLPVLLAVCPLLGGIGTLLLARAGGVRSIPTWTCGSSVTPRSQYTATAFSKPIRRIFGFVLFPDHREIRETGASRWFPVRIRYEVTSRYIVDEFARDAAAFAQRLARRARIVQAGFLRIYLIYAVVAVIVLLVVAR